MRIRRWSLVSVLVAMALVAAGCGSDDDKETTGTTAAGGTATSRPGFPAGTTMANLQSKGKIVVGTKFNQLGSGLKNPITGKLEGFDIEIAKLIAVGLFGGTVDDVESKIDFKETVSAVREAAIQNGDVDMIVATYTINPARKQQVDFAGPYIVDGQDILVKSDNNTIKSITDLNGKKVCTVSGSTTPANLEAKSVKPSELILLADYPLCTTELRQGRVEAFVTDRGILLGQIEANKDQFKLVGVNVSEEPLGIGLKKGDDAFREFINTRLEQIEASGEWKAAYDRTLGKLGLTAPQPPPVDRYASTGTATTAAATTTTKP